MHKQTDRSKHLKATDIYNVFILRIFRSGLQIKSENETSWRNLRKCCSGKVYLAREQHSIHKIP